MGTPKEIDGQDHDQVDAPDVDTEDGESGQDDKEETIGDLNARMDLLHGTINELRQAVLSRGAATAPAPAVEEDLDDGEPLTAGKVSRIVKKSINDAVSQSTQVNERTTWDGKAKADFPLTDPKFLREFQKQWNEQVSSGLDPRHPKAVYNVAQQTARALGTHKKPAPRTRDAETSDTSEAPNRGATRESQRAGQQTKISDDDPRVRFYKLRERTKEQVAAFKAKLAQPKKGRRA